MANGGKVVIQINGDTSGFNKAIGTIGSVTTTAAKASVGAISAIGTAVVGLGTIGFNYNKQIETYTTNFEVMLGDAGLAVEKVEALKKMGASTPFELGDLAGATEQLLAFGVANEDTQIYLQQLGDISLGNVDKLNTLTNAFGKMNSTGKVTLETINMMAEQGFNPLQEISRTTGESMESLYDRVSAGEVSLDEITGAFKSATSAGGQFEGGMAKASQTTAGLISTLKDNATALVGEVFTPISDGILQDVLPNAIGAIETLSTAFKEDGVEGLIEAGGDLLGGLIVGITEKIPDVAEMAIDILTSLVQALVDNSDALATASGELLTALMEGFFALWPMLTELALELIINFANYLAENAPSLIDGAIAMVVKLAELIVENLPIIILATIEIVTAIIQALADNAPLFIDSAIMLMGALIDGLWQALPSILSALGGLINSLIDLIVGYYGTWLEKGKALIQYLWDGATTVWDSFTGWIGEKIEEFLGFFDTMFDSFFEIGENIIDGLWEGISGGWDWLTGKVESLADSLFDAAKDVLGIASPSKRFKWIGEMTTEGLDQGLESGRATTKGLMESYANDIALSMSNIPTPQPLGGYGGASSAQTINNNSTRQGDMVLQIDKLMSNSKDGYKTLFEEMEFYRAQYALAKG